MKSPDRKQHQTPRELKIVENLIKALNLSKMNATIYPAGHRLISQSLDDAYGILQKIFAVQRRITIGVAGETLFVDKETLEKENPNHKQFAQSLKDLSISAITMSQGLTKDELLKFQMILSMKPSAIPTSETLENILATNRIVHIKATYLTLNYFHFTEDKKAERGDTTDTVKSEDEVWVNFISSLTDNGTDRNEQKSRLSKLTKIDSVDFAKTLNTKLIDWDVFLDDYGDMITKKLHPGDEEKTSTYHDDIIRINGLIKDFHPKLKQQLLAMIEQKVSSLPLSSIASDKLDCFSFETITEIIRSASDEKREISPSLILLFQKMSNIQDESSDGSGKAFEKAPQIAQDTSLSTEELEILIQQREKYESYVPSDYKEILAQKAMAGGVDGDIGPEKFFLDEHLKTLEEARVDLQIHQLLLALMDEDIDEDEYHHLSMSIAKAIPEFLSLGHFPFLIDLIKTLRRHTKEKPSENIRMIAGSGLTVFNDASVLSRALKPFIHQGISIPYLTDFIVECGSKNVPWLLDLYLETVLPKGQVIVVELLRHFSEEAINEILNSPSTIFPYHLKKFLVLLQIIGDAGIIPFVKRLADHPDTDVRLEVISTLLKFEDPQAKSLLHKAIASKDIYESSQAIILACRKRVMEFVVKLTSMIKTFIVSEKDLALNEIIIAEVVKMGDPQMMIPLEKLAGRKLSLFPRRLSLTKRALYQSLCLNPIHCSVQLIRTGLDSKDEQVRALCMELMKTR